MKKIAILTHFYDNNNYGGTLQAYALCRFLNNCGFNATQISYHFLGDYDGLTHRQRVFLRLKRNPLYLFVMAFKFFSIKIFHRNNKKSSTTTDSITNKRNCVFESFRNEYIPHTEKVYRDNNIHFLNGEYDYYLTGSDQVFSFRWFREPFWLTFTQGNKLSYAASMASENIPKNRISFIKKALSDYKAIGLREQKSIDLISQIIDGRIALNADPVFLLSANDWMKISSERLIKGEYVFCYFLGDTREGRAIASEYAKKNKLFLVSIPMALKNGEYIDLDYGDYILQAPSPKDFISLILFSKCVFTDSFHASAFSIIFQKNFYVFDRDKNHSMNSRIISLLECIDEKDRYFVSGSECNNNLRLMDENQHVFNATKLDQLISSSKAYLLDNME